MRVLRGPAARPSLLSSRGSKPSQRSACSRIDSSSWRVVVEDDDGAARPTELGELRAHASPARARGGGGATRRPRRRLRCRRSPASRPRHLPSISPRDELHVREPRAACALARERELRLGSIERDDALEDGREHLEQRAVAGARVDRERAMREGAGASAARYAPSSGGGAASCALAARAAPREELARVRVARARAPPRRARGCRPPRTGARPLASASATTGSSARRSPGGAASTCPARRTARSPALAQRRRVAARFRAGPRRAAPPARRRQLLLRGEREKAQPHRLGEQAVELPAVGGGGGGFQHRRDSYIPRCE